MGSSQEIVRVVFRMRLRLSKQPMQRSIIRNRLKEAQENILLSMYREKSTNNSKRFSSVSFMVDENKTWPAVLCFVKANTDLSETISDIEKQLSGIRGSQRMRALITLGDNIKEGIEAIQRENLFTGIVCVNAIGNENDTQNFIKTVNSHKRYPRCWMEILPESKEYGFSSNIHILLKESDLEHEFRSRKCKEANVFTYWEDWILYLNNRIHV